MSRTGEIHLSVVGAAGMPVLRFGACLRVPRWALLELAATGRVVRLCDAAVMPVEGQGVR